MARPHLLAQFLRHLAGDDALLRLAGRRLQAAELGAEFYPDSLEQLEFEWQFRPRTGSVYTAHLPRHLDVTERAHRQVILAYARRFAGRLYGLVVHDHRGWQEQLDPPVRGMIELDQALADIDRSPRVFVEYARGLSLENFTGLFRAVVDHPHVSACIDIGHLGIFAARWHFEAVHPDLDFFSIRPESPELPELLSDLNAAVAAGLPAVLEAVRALGALGKPLHFHLHDGHPLVTWSMYQVRDHQSFFQRVPLPFAHAGSHELPLLFGPAGLKQIVRAVLDTAAGSSTSFTLEIHPPPGQEPLGQHADLFPHWTDLTHAERTNRWLSCLLENGRLLREACAAAGGA